MCMLILGGLGLFLKEPTTARSLDMKSIVMALAGEELTSISNSDADEYCAKHLHRWSIDADRQGRS